MRWVLVACCVFLFDASSGPGPELQEEGSEGALFWQLPPRPVIARLGLLLATLLGLKRDTEEKSTASP
ncbi:MAG: hypothetical protein NVSMB32_14050 [Actinomycetota bacterium]